MCEIADQFTVDAFFPEEAAALLFGRVETAKRIIKKVRLRQRMMETGSYSLPVPRRPRSGPPPMRPVCTLSRLNRSTVFPPLVAPKIECSELSLTKIINFVSQRRAAGAPSHCLLDLLSTASKLSIATCAELLIAEKIIEERLGTIDIAATRAARLFWTLYAEGRALYSGMVAEGNVAHATGDLAFFDRRGLEVLLPGVILPDHCRRREFITNYLADSDPPCVDLYSATGLLLVRHPFISTLNPLLFGHPSKPEIKSTQLKTMKLLTDCPNVPDEVIIRNLSDGPDYRPDWRNRTAQRYLLQARGTDSFPDSIDGILEQERDPFVRQLVLFSAGRRSVIADRIKYALRCVQDEAETRIPASIKAMIIADRSSQQIAKRVGTTSENISTFEKIFFDIRRYRDNEAWIKAICCPNLDRTAPAYRLSENRLMSIAFNRGWPGLHDLVGRHSSKIGPSDSHRLIRGLVARAADFVKELEMEGVPPSDRDLRMLLAALDLMKSAGLVSGPGDLAFPDPLEPEEEERQKIASAMPVEMRRRIAEAYRIIMFALERHAKQKSDQSGG